MAIPLIAAVSAKFLIGEPLSIKKISGILVGLFGVFIIALLPSFEKKTALAGNISGNFLILIACFAFALYTVGSRHLISQKKYSPLTITATLTFITMLISFPFFLFETVSINKWWLNLQPSSVLALLYVAIVSTIITYLLNQYAIKHGGAVFASTTLYLQPLFAYLSAAVLLGERLTEGLIIGGVLILFGVFLSAFKKGGKV